MNVKIEASKRIMAANTGAVLKAIVGLIAAPDTTKRPDHGIDGPQIWVKSEMGTPQLSIDAKAMMGTAKLLSKLPNATIDIAMVARGTFVVILNETGVSDRDSTHTAAAPNPATLKRVLTHLQGDLQAKYHTHGNDVVADFQGPSAAIGAKMKLPLSFNAGEARAAATALAQVKGTVLQFMALGTGHTSVTMVAAPEPEPVAQAPAPDKEADELQRGNDERRKEVQQLMTELKAELMKTYKRLRAKLSKLEEGTSAYDKVFAEMQEAVKRGHELEQKLTGNNEGFKDEELEAAKLQRSLPALRAEVGKHKEGTPEFEAALQAVRKVTDRLMEITAPEPYSSHDDEKRKPK